MSVEQLAAAVRNKITLLASANESAINFSENVYARSNEQLRQDIGVLLKKLINLELIAGHNQYQIPEKLVEISDPIIKAPSPVPPPSKPVETPAPPGTKPKGGNKIGGSVDLPVDISRIDMRVGKVVQVERHPDADSLYVEQVDLGEGHLRTVISGLVQHLPIEKLHGLVGIFMCNLRPVKMRGIESQGMLMCSTDADGKVEPLMIESASEPILGDRVYVEANPGEPDPQLNPKKKVWEQVKPDMRVNDVHLATYKGAPWKLRFDPNAVIRASTAADAQIS